MSSVFLPAITSKLEPHSHTGPFTAMLHLTHSLKIRLQISKLHHLLQESNEKGNTVFQYGNRNGKTNLTDIKEAKVNRTW